MCDKSRTVLSLQNVFFRYRTRSKWLLRGLSLDVKRGQRIAIVGDNGVGKTTIARLALGLYRPKNGRVLLLNTMASWRTHFPDLGYIGRPDDAEGELALPADFRVVDLLRAYWTIFETSGRSQDINEGRLRSALELDKPEISEERIGELSKGQRQRVLAYLALAKAPSLVIADEPTEGLDARSREVVLNEVQRASSDGSTSLVWISHRLDEVCFVASAIYELREGKLSQKANETARFSLRTNGETAHETEVPVAAAANKTLQAMLSPTVVKMEMTLEKHELSTGHSEQG